MSYFALVAQLRYNAVRLHTLPAVEPTQAERKVMRALLTSTLDTLSQLTRQAVAQSPPALPRQLVLERMAQSLRLLEHQLLALSPGQEAPPALWATLQQTLRRVLAEVNAPC